MPTLTISLPKELKAKLDSKVPGWKEKLIQRLELRADQLLKFEEMISKGRV